MTAAVSVLIVEDRDDTRIALRRLLVLDGYRVREAADGHAALAALFAEPPDVALIDLGLPGIDGLEVARQARTNPLLANVRLIALTGHGRPEDRQSMIEAGFDEHLIKPVTAPELFAAIEPPHGGAR
jgi:CheY-like chemotaxis protein